MDSDFLKMIVARSLWMVVLILANLTLGCSHPAGKILVNFPIPTPTPASSGSGVTPTVLAIAPADSCNLFGSVARNSIKTCEFTLSYKSGITAASNIVVSSLSSPYSITSNSCVVAVRPVF